MKSLALTDVTRRIGEPPDWNEERDGPCRPLEVCDHEGFMISAWAPSSEAERERIAAGAPIFLHLRGVTHPVVAMAVGEVPTKRLSVATVLSVEANGK
jgi:hypothetical protein